MDAYPLMLRSTLQHEMYRRWEEAQAKLMQYRERGREIEKEKDEDRAVREEEGREKAVRYAFVYMCMCMYGWMYVGQGD
jgi:hypothetical protein